MGRSHDIEKTAFQSVQEVNQDAPPAILFTHKKRRHWEKLGVYNVWVLILGTVVVLGAIGFLTFLWTVSIQQNPSIDNWSSNPKHHAPGKPPHLWTLILQKEWTSRAVTFSTVVIRVALAAQLAVFAALMAALILERVGATTEDLPLLSMIRCANTGPQALVWNIMHTITKGTQLGYSIIILITIFNALALQFTSTILLGDFGVIDVVLGSTQKSVPWGINNTGAFRVGGKIGGATDFWRTTQTSYPSFAEYKKSGSQGANFVDTGFTYRGFLPFVNASQREALRSYSGPMTIIDERVICVKPKLSEIVYDLLLDADDTLSAVMDFNNVHPDILQIDTTWNKINCTMPNRKEEQPGFWHASLCQLEYGKGQLRQGMLPDSNQRRFNETNVWLVFNVSGPVQSNWSGLAVNDHDNIRFPMREIKSPGGPWAKIGATNISIDVSACLLNLEPEVYNLKASFEGATPLYDGQISWYNGEYDTFDMRRMLMALGERDLNYFEAEFRKDHTKWFQSDEGRGIMTISPPADWQAVNFERKAGNEYYRAINDALKKLRPFNYNQPKNDSFVLTPLADGPESMHRNDLWIAQEILNYTNNPALAMQALSHIVLQTAYYDWFDSYNLKVISTITETVPRSVPIYYRRLVAVSCLLALHFVLLGQALILFLTRTDMSLLGNGWQAIAQVSSNDTVSALYHGTMATDREVLHNAKASGLVDTRVVIKRSELSGRLEATSFKANS